MRGLQDRMEDCVFHVALARTKQHWAVLFVHICLKNIIRQGMRCLVYQMLQNVMTTQFQYLGVLQ